VALPERAVRIAFLRGVYRNAAAQTEASRNAYLDGLDDVCLKQLHTGRGLESASSTGSSSAYRYFDGWEPGNLLALSEWARGYVAEDTIEEAKALVSPPVRFVSTSFSGVCR